MSSHASTLLKARKILGCYDQIEPRKYCVQPHKKSNEKNRLQMSYSSASKSESRMKKDFSFCKSQKKNQSLNSSKLSLKPKIQSNTSFVSSYGKQTRYDKIMKLKVKPTFKETAKVDRTKKSVLNSSISSNGSEKQHCKQNYMKNKVSRLDKIMNIKVSKPKVNSTLVHYEPRQGSRSITKQKRQSVVKELKQCQQKMKKSKQQQQKEDRLWKVFERERELRSKLKKQAEQRQYKQRRRKQQRFESLISKQVTKIQKDKQVSKRKNEGFSNYIYPSY